MKQTAIKFDPADWAGMVDLMGRYGDSRTAFEGENESGEPVRISIFPEKIVVVTSQRNHHERENVYHWDGTVEELYK